MAFDASQTLLYTPDATAPYTELPIECLNSKHATAIGASIYGAVAGGAYASVIEASQNMKCSIAKTYYPIKEDNEKYEKIYAEYEKLRDAFCDGTLNTMKYLFEN